MREKEGYRETVEILMDKNGGKVFDDDTQWMKILGLSRQSLNDICGKRTKKTKLRSVFEIVKTIL